MDGSRVKAVVIHAVYLINCATDDPELRKKSLTSLTHALRIGDGIGAAGVVLHPGAQKGKPLAGSMRRASRVIKEALKQTESCPLLLEQTAGHQGLLGRDFDQTARLIELAGGDERLGLCLDSCHLFVQGFDIRDPEKLAEVLDEADAKVGLSGCAACTSTTPARRSAPAETATPTSATARWAATGSPPSSPSRASRGCRRRSRSRARTSAGRTASRSRRRSACASGA